ncbi:hypothetical protein [Streptomyces yaizuensis]|uniref:Uncharacterized protein n=1 Tax=Streptomyces yaizuensis TaxID=2989713 RepID=A0ABQ5NZT8_9ACTN|nr:hypothetical protein [Streptomyces sp. YSPA8]GLF95863.1 hypothetical protein SYYSPA8_16220 [Streptomyces sp. YSPA8]
MTDSAKSPAPQGSYPDFNPLAFPPCECPDPDCTLKSPRQGAGESLVILALRARVREDNERRRTFGDFGR